MIKRFAPVLFVALVAAGCGSTVQAELAEVSPTFEVATTVAPTSTTSQTSSSAVVASSLATTTTEPEEPSPAVTTGAQALVDSDFGALAGRRVGLIVNQNSVVDVDGQLVHIADLAHEHRDVEVMALFGPEHGVRGTADAGELVEDAVDPSTGLPVFSLFGATRKPTPEMLEGIDTLVYDLQDVGARYYTYISTLGLAMEAAAEAGIDVVVLDRPNPLGGTTGGGVLESARQSFVGQYPIPAQYGLTSGELANLIVEQEWLDGVNALDLTVVPLDGWDRSMTWVDTGLPWIAPSPAITSADTALLYPATIYFEATSLSYGRGTASPFTLFGAPWLDAPGIADELTGRDLPGVSFEATEVMPEMLDGITVAPAFLGERIPAVQLRVTDPNQLAPTELGVHLLDVVTRDAQRAGVDPLARPDWLDQLSGSTLLRDAIQSGDVDPAALIATQTEQVRAIDELLESVHVYR